MRKTMTNNEINKAIAEACGWILTAMNWWYKDGEYFALSPDYCTNLNAMHEAESWLKNDDQHVFSCYASDLFDEYGIDAIHLSAYQRAKSFLRYINLHKP